MGELEEDVHRPCTRGPQGQFTLIQVDPARDAAGKQCECGDGGRDEVVHTKIVEMFEGIVSQHRPPLEALDVEKGSGRWRTPLHSDHPLEDRKQPCDNSIKRYRN